MENKGLVLSRLVHQLVEQTASKHPDTIALILGGDTLTYRQLNEQAETICHTILNVDPDAALIGVSSARSLDMVIGVLAVLKAGKAYLPLDPTYPAQRLEQISIDSGIKTCLATAQDAPVFEQIGLHVISSGKASGFVPQSANRQKSTAYVLYTSGSTGKPKGVSMGHGPLMNLLHWQAANSEAAVGTRTLQLAPLSFDVSFQEIFATLSTGGTLILIDEELRLDLTALLAFIDEQSVNRLFLPFVALQYLAEAAVSTQRFPSALREIMTAGEQLKITPQLTSFFTALPNCVLFNQYGPTECHVVSQLKLEGNPTEWPLLPSIGKAIDNVSLFIADDNLTLLPEGESGELLIAGDCLAEGYLHQEALTNEKFIELAIPGRGITRIYRTGDLARYQPDGTIEFLGRRDDQVKIRGHRVELGELEVIINQLQGVKQAVVVAREGIGGQKQLIAYLVSSGETKENVGIRKELEQRLPDYMMPSAFVWMDDFPKTSSGKVDKKKLPAPEQKRPELAVTYRKPKTSLEQTIANVWATLLQLDKVGLDDNFFELGGNSLLAQKIVAALKQEQQSLPVTKLYQYPTIAGIARYLQPQALIQAGNEVTEPQPRKGIPSPHQADVAIIGMTGRFPGATTIDEFWDLLKQGRETTRFFTDEELDVNIPSRLKNDPLYVKARGVIDNADQFDAQFFGLAPTVAQLMDPQQRVFLEIAWEALEQTGYLPQQYNGRVGVFAGCGNNTYYLNNVLTNTELVDQVGSFQVMTLNEKDYIASRTAYQLNLKGPAVSVYSACSTSLLAITQAVQSIRSGQCDVALAGGATITAPINSGHLYQEGAMFSKDGHCRSFDAQGEGTVFSDGAGVVLLKNLDAARRDGDTIYGVIKGVGVNNDGAGKGSFTAPNAEGQAAAIAMAIQDAQIEPTTISYVEAHGTATPLGDPIEIEGLTIGFGEQIEKQYCAIGSVKSNMGHLTAAAGVAGLIKTTLALYHRQIPASLHYSTVNPAINFAETPFFVNTKLTEWTPTGVRESNPRRAGVSSFGVGGTNVHVVLEEFIQEEPETTAGRPVQLITWSAKSLVSRETYADRLAEKLRQKAPLSLADTAFTLQTTRPDFKHRRFAVAATSNELLEKLTATTVTPSTIKTVKEAPGEVVFMFPGQGAQFLNMGRMLYDHETVYRQAVDECADLLKAYMEVDIRQVIYQQALDVDAEQRLKNTRYTQPALFVTEYALAKLWMSWGIEPSIFCGHSIGEFVAAHLAGVFTLADALMLIATRGQLVSEQPRGSMLSVRMPAETLQAMLPSSLSVAAINSHKLCVVAGPDEHIADFARLLDEQEILNQPLETSHAFHSTMMDPVVDRFEEIVRKVALNRPQKPLVSTVTGSWLSDAQATDTSYWANHLRATVRFADAITTIVELENPLLMEVGPGHVTATLARQQTNNKPITVLAGLVNNPDEIVAYQSVLTTLGQLYLNGLEPDWAEFYAHQSRKRLNLPTYAFDRKRCWVDPVRSSISSIQTNTTPDIATSSTPIAQPAMRKHILINKINTLLEDASGIDMEGVTPDMSFLEIGLDSLLLTQVALTLKKEFNVPVTFRQLTSEYATPELLANYLDRTLPISDAPAPISLPIASSVQPEQTYVAPVASYGGVPVAANDSALGLIAQQLQLLAKQVALMQGTNPEVVISPAPVVQAVVTTNTNRTAEALSMPKTETASLKVATIDTADLTPEEKIELKKPFGATARIERQSSELTNEQQFFLERLTRRYNQKTKNSKAYAQQHRSHMADPRVVSGFRPLTKEIVYPLVVNRSKGSHLWDIDGNEYIDALNGFGSNMFGYQPDLIKQALHDQIENGYEVGPQHELAGEVSQLICELTGTDRAALCNTGSEAVLGTMRIARTVTGRSLIVAFSGSYHGIADEVLVRGTKKLKSFPAAPGIMPESVQNMLILDYGTEESLKIIQERAHELAAVLVEPVQSRRPEFVPIDFLKQVRAITAASGTALIFDEVITGFRTHPGGAQALFGIKADLASYGKVVGAGLPIGVIAGKRAFMDALDGGFWQYGDSSVPEVGVTYFAGTFVRHPMALAAAKASLQYMKEKGPSLQQELTQKTKRLADALNVIIDRQQIPLVVAQFGSLWKIKFKEEIPYGELLFTLMREKGIHIWDGFPCFLSEAHTNEEIDSIIDRFSRSINELIDAGFLDATPTLATRVQMAGVALAGDLPPVQGARLGRDQLGNPAWFIPNPERPGKYLQVKLNEI
ncbi:amino acid adenylation domain-containing protein [Spirosoma aureum]|uniref:Amino acid adenylation domain-containing protein n=1 Tax=Spirosoma aureum TaxID=2692134 RepID=A0A6G9AGS7_9BACT|nr:polyketide synthase [Spirosoma aureum]QIP11495.1 amino acid adenylation domain-containing protein [Spirosoma aureum]